MVSGFLSEGVQNQYNKTENYESRTTECLTNKTEIMHRDEVLLAARLFQQLQG